MSDVKFRIEVSGLDKLLEKLGALAPKVKHAAETELYHIAEEIMANSKEVVPVDTGALMSTGHVDAPVETDHGVSISMGYGGPAAPYALYVHEELDPNINWSRPGSGPKFLENPVISMQPDIAPRIKKAVLEAL